MSSRLTISQKIENLIYGYTRNVEKECDLYMNIEDGIVSIIHAFYPKSLRFDYYDTKKFKLSEDGTIIKR